MVFSFFGSMNTQCSTSSSAPTVIICNAAFTSYRHYSNTITPPASLIGIAFIMHILFGFRTAYGDRHLAISISPAIRLSFFPRIAAVGPNLYRRAPTATDSFPRKSRPVPHRCIEYRGLFMSSILRCTGCLSRPKKRFFPTNWLRRPHVSTGLAAVSGYIGPCATSTILGL